MSYLLEILGRGLLAELSAAFVDLLRDDGHLSTAELHDACEQAQDDAAPAIQYGVRCLSNREYMAARAAFDSALSVEPDSLNARLGLACVADELGRMDEAARHLTVARQYDPYEPRLLFALGLCREKQGLLNDAAAAYADCLEAAPNLRNAHERAAAICLKRSDVEGAIERYEQICWYEPEDVVASLTLANLYLQAERLEEAIQRYQLVLTLEPDNWEAQDDLACAYEEAGLFYEAIETLSQLVNEQPDFPDYHIRIGDLHHKLGNADLALQEYRRAAELNPNYLEASVKVGTSLLRQGEYLEAARWFNRAVEINDRLLAAYVGLGVAQFELGRSDDAMASFEMAASVEPNSTLLFSETARLHLKTGAQRQAEKYLGPERMVAEEPASYGSVGDLIDRQIERHREALKQRPNYADLHYRLGLLLKQRGDIREAVDCFINAVSINPNYTKALIQLGLSFHDVGRTDEGIHALIKALRLDPDAVDLHYRLGLMFVDREQFGMAVEHFEAALEQEPRNVDFHANLALALQNMGLVDRATGAWHTLCDLAEQAEGAGAGTSEPPLGG